MTPHVATVRLLDTGAIGDDTLAGLLHLLGPDEIARCGRFVRRERRRQFVAGRVLLRQALGQLLGMAAGEVRLAEQPGNAPRLDLPGCPGVGFSISHSGAWVGCAVSAGTALGFDIEVIDPQRDVAALAEQAFDAGENAWLAARPQETRVRDFYDLWSEKEARFKLESSSAKRGHCLSLHHPRLALAMCSAEPLSHAELLLATLAPGPVPEPR